MSEIESVAAIAAAAAAADDDTGGSQHHILAQLTHLEQEANLIQEELDKLEKIEKALAGFKEMVSTVQTRPDPLLPLTNGPSSPSWDQWFKRPRDPKGCRCWAL